jgi:hypothetical protein
MSRFVFVRVGVVGGDGRRSDFIGRVGDRDRALCFPPSSSALLLASSGDHGAPAGCFRGESSWMEHLRKECCATRPAQLRAVARIPALG